MVEPSRIASESPSGAQRGHRLRMAREARGISLRELARRLNVSPGHVSQIERDIATPSISLLYDIVTELGVSMSELFEEENAAMRVSTSDSADPGSTRDLTAVRLEDKVAGPSGFTQSIDDKHYVCRAADRQVIMASPGVRWELLTSSPQAAVDFREIFYEPASDASEEVQMIRHSGSEYGLVLEGTLHVQIEFETFVLSPGDSISFESARPHRFWNEGPGIARTVFLSNVHP